MMKPLESEVHWLEDFTGYMHFEPIPEPMMR